MEKDYVKKESLHYAWKILAACCLIQGAGLGVANNCAGLFYVPICQELGFSRGDIALYMTFQNMSCCFGMLCSQKILKHFKLRYVLSAAALLTGLPFFGLSRASQLWHWYVLGTVQGLGMAFLTSLVVPIVLSCWFQKRLGMALGASAAFSGLTGAVMSAVLGIIIRRMSWRTGYVLSGMVLLLMVLPASLLVMYMTPEEKGMKPYGWEQSLKEAETLTEKHQTAGGKRAGGQVCGIILLGALSKSLCSFVSHLPAYGNEIPTLFVDVSLLTTFSMLGNMLSKLVFGSLNDRLGAKKAATIAISIIAAAILLLLSKGQTAVCIGAFLFGTVMMFAVTELPLIAKTIWDQENYAKVMVGINVASYVSYSFTISLYGYIYDWMGHYDGLLTMMLGVLVLEALLVRGMLPQNPKIPAQK